MLWLEGERFSRGRSKFVDHAPGRAEITAKIYVKVQFGSTRTMLAQLDTGAAWSVLDQETAQGLGSSLDRIGSASMSTRLGSLTGYLVQTPITFPADEGQALTVMGTFFVSTDWPVPFSFLGYSGLLDSIRFALDPQANDFYFGLPW